MTRYASMMVLILMAGCGAAAPPVAPRAAGDDVRARLAGTWETACAGRTRTTLRYEGDRFSGVYARFADDACTLPLAENAWDGHVENGAALDERTHAIDLRFESFTATQHTEEAARAASAQRYCGLDGWAVGEPRDVYGRPCAGWAIPVGARSYERVRLDGDELRFGQGTPVRADTTAADRPSRIDEQRVFRRVQ